MSEWMDDFSRLYCVKEGRREWRDHLAQPPTATDRSA